MVKLNTGIPLGRLLVRLSCRPSPAPPQIFLEWSANHPSPFQVSLRHSWGSGPNDASVSACLMGARKSLVANTGEGYPANQAPASIHAASRSCFGGPKQSRSDQPCQRATASRTPNIFPSLVEVREAPVGGVRFSTCGNRVVAARRPTANKVLKSPAHGCGKKRVSA